MDLIDYFVKQLAKKRPFIYATTVVSIFSFILLAPVMLLTMLNLSNHIVFETSDIHFQIIEISEDELLDEIYLSLDDFNIEELSTVEINDTHKFRTLSIFFQLKTNKKDQINKFTESLKSNQSLLFTSENWESYIAEDFMQNDYLLPAQLLSLLIFSFYYLSFFRYKFFEAKKNQLNRYKFLLATAVTFSLVLFVQVLYLLFNTIGVNFTELENLFKKSIDTDWILYLSIILLAPLLEELVFRGLILQNFLLNKIHLKGAFYTSLLFASLHQWQIWQATLEVKISHFVIMFVVSMVFCWLYKKTARLWVPIYAHVLYNSTLLLIDEYWS